MTTHTRHLVVVFSIAAVVCLLVAGVSSQTETLRRVTHTPPESLNLNPSISGDGRRVVFESNADLAGNGNARVFRAVVADLSSNPISFAGLGDSRAPAPAVSQDGTRVAFASKDDPLGKNQDGNSEIFYFDGSGLKQLTDTSPDDPSQRTAHGAFRPSISDDGLLIAFSSNRNLTGENSDANSEIFTYDVRQQNFTQLTNTTDEPGATDAKASGDGSHVAFIHERPSSASTARDLVVLERSSGTPRTVVSGADGLALAYGRAISDDGTRVVYSSNTGVNTSQVFLFDGRNQLVRQITSLGSRATDVPLNPTISGDGTRIAFATRRNVAGGNSDAGVELYVYDIPSGAFTRVTNAPGTATAEVVSSLNDDGMLVAFNFPRVLSEPATLAEFANDSEIYVAAMPAHSEFETGLKISNGASLGKSPALPNTVAPDSIAVASGSRLALTSTEAQRLPDNSFPRNLRGTTISVNGRAAQIFFTSPIQINFHVPPETESGTAQVSVRNPDGLEIRGTVNVARAAPGVFTQGGSGTGEAVALDAFTLQRAPFDALDANGDPRRLILFATGVRGASNVSITIGGGNAVVEAVVPSPGLPGLDQIHIVLSSNLKGAGTVPLVLAADGARGNASTLSFTDGGGTPRPARINISPSAATIPVGGSMQFKASAFDANDEEITGAQFVFSISNQAVATINSNGLATGLTEGTASITATGGSLSATAQLRVLPRTLVINEVLADPPDGSAGDANHDGTRSGSDDEFVELVNATDTSLDVSGWSLRTRALTGTTETTRHVFPAGTLIPASDALVLFGGGSFDPDNPLFGGAQVFKASTGGLSLTNSGLTILVRDAAGNLITQISYGTADDNLGGDSIDQSITRAPDITGSFSRHTSIASGRKFSPGVRADGSFFVPRAGRLTRASLQPVAQEVFDGETAQFTAQAFDHFDRPMTGVALSFTSGDPNVATIERINTDETTGIATAFVKARGPGSARINATASDGTQRIESNPSTLTVKPLPPKVVRVEVEPSSVVLNRGGKLRRHLRRGNTPVQRPEFRRRFDTENHIAQSQRHGRHSLPQALRRER
ncbi:MAG: lamin tail domain-containing protein [Acidobacteria bacterium]|nr:lamin tail domain-containing protein [Acidobacteriota bacterium]